MYLIDSLSVLVRRWYVVLAGLVVLTGGAAAVVTYVPTEYQSSGQMVFLLPPSASGTGEPVNPYLNLQNGLTTAASLVSGSVSTKDVVKEMKDAGMDAEYAVAVVPGTGPLISVTAKHDDPDMATVTRDAVMSWIDAELTRIQDEVDTPRAQYISATRSSVSRTAEALPGSKLRALAAVGVVVGLLTLALTFALDRLLLRRAARRARPPVRRTPVRPTAVRPTATGRRGDDARRDVVDEEPGADDDETGDSLVLRFHAKRQQGSGGSEGFPGRRPNRPKQSSKRPRRDSRVGSGR